MDPTDITHHDVEALRATGFATVERLVDDDTVELLRDAYDDILSGRVQARGDRRLGGVIRQVKHPAKAHPVFADNAAIDAGLALGRALLCRDDLAKVYDMLIDKPAGAAAITPWHQDIGYFGRPVAVPGTSSRIPDLQFWLALDPVDADNGCMQFLPSPYGAPACAHQVVSGDPDDESRLIAFVDPPDTSRAVPCPLPAGGCTLHYLGTPHFTGSNTTDRPRRAYIFNIGIQSLAEQAESQLEAEWGASARL